MSIKEQARKRLAVGVAGVVLGIALVVGVAPVAADNDAPEPRDVNVGQEATGMTSDTRLVITEIAAPAVVSNTSIAAPAAPVVENRDDRAPDAADTGNAGDD